MIRNTLLTLTAVLALSFELTAQTVKPLTAFEARAIAQKALGEQVKNNVIQISGGRSDDALTPTDWKFVFWDPTARQNGRLVTVSGKTVTELRDGYFELDRMRMFAYKQDEIIDPKRLKIDSNKALEAVQKSSLLDGVRLSTVTFHLTLHKKVMPMWRLHIFADRQGAEVDLGYALVSAESGAIAEMKLALDRLKKK